jgi:L-threonine-O-3-phosphate decarboxylase
LDRSNRPTHGGNLVWAAAIAGCPVSQILDFSASINPLGPSLRVVSAVQSQINEIANYPTPGYLELRRALGQYHQVDPDWVLPGNGAAELLTWAGRALAHSSNTIVCTPAFNDYERALSGMGAPVIKRSLINSAGEIQDLAQLLLDIAPDTALLLNNPHNPTGLLWSIDLLKPLLDRFSLVVVDESFMDFVSPSASLIPLVADYPNLVVIRSLTKFYSLPGLRLGYAISQPDRLRQWQSWRDPWAVNHLAETAGIVAIADQEFIDDTWQWYRACQPSLYAGLQQIPNLTVYPSAANFFLLRTVQPFTTVQTQLLQKFQIFARDCMSFPELGEQYGRVALKSAADNQKLLAALHQICA